MSDINKWFWVKNDIDLDLEANSENLEDKEDRNDKEYKILRTNMAAQDLGFSFLIDANPIDEFKNRWKEVYNGGDVSTTNNYYIGFKVCTYTW